MRRAVENICLFVCVALMGGGVFADETGVYESLADVEVGRVFLSPDQRAHLDERRGKAPVPVAATSAGTSPVKKKPGNTAGYIVSSSGISRVWSNGDFVAAEEVSKVRFPGDIRITRKNVSDADRGAADDGT